MSDLNLDDLKKKPVTKNARLQVSISKPVLDRFEDFAERNGLDRAKLAEKAIEMFMDKVDPKK
jgi:metal-responsive CopG/Arc/MetJ family transcriptional regulator